jgi:hypothetical protein
MLLEDSGRRPRKERLITSLTTRGNPAWVYLGHYNKQTLTLAILYIFILPQESMFTQNTFVRLHVEIEPSLPRSQAETNPYPTHKI